MSWPSDRIAAAYPTGRRYSAPDGAPAHTAEVAQRWAVAHLRVTLLRLPTCASAEENPLERAWSLMTDAVAVNRLSGNIDDVVHTATRFFIERTTQPRVVLPLAA